MEIANLILEYIQVIIWPSITIIIILIFRKQISAILSKLHKANIGGVLLDFKEEIQEARQLSTKVEAIPIPEKRKKVPSIPMTEANARLIDLGLQPSPSGLNMNFYIELANYDPNLALAGLRIEIDILTRNLVKGFKLELNLKNSASRLLKELYQKEHLTEEQYQLTIKILEICNSVIHGRIISKDEAISVLNVARILAEQYLDWLSWNFDDGWKPSKK